jgi:hypothetical protein
MRAETWAMDRIVVKNIPFALDMNLLVGALRLQDNPAGIEYVRRLANDAMRIGRPKALYRSVQPQYPDDEHVVMRGIPFKSRVLKSNLCSSDIVLPFLGTCGRELDQWAQQFTDIIQRFWVDTILALALGSALQSLEASLRKRCHPRSLSMMNPGSLPDWPLQEQKQLFSLFGNDAALIGVTLTQGFMMKPLKSLSGVFFASDAGFVNCQLCPREGCPGRRAPCQKPPAHPSVPNGCGD